VAENNIYSIFIHPNIMQEKQSRNMDNYREWKRKKYEENTEKERQRKREYARRNKERINELSRLSYHANKKKYLARQKLKNAIKKGVVKRANLCEQCGSLEKIQAHHYDYEKPLEVNRLCVKCHLAKHR
jgi:hypothetical protein